MSQDLYGNPPGGGVDYGAIGEKVKLPAIFMMVIGGLSILGNLLSLVANLAGIGMGGLSGFGGGREERIFQMFSGGMGIVVALLGLVVNAVVIFGAMKMKALTGYTLAMTAAILAIVPCSCCCLNIPFGIWSLVVLLDSNVKAAFRT